MTRNCDWRSSQGNQTDLGKSYLTLVTSNGFGGCFEEKDQEELVTPSKTINVLGDEQVKDISPTTLRSCCYLKTKVQKIKLLTKGQRYKREEFKEFAGTGLGTLKKLSLPLKEKKTKRTIIQEEAGLAEAIRLDALEKLWKRKNEVALNKFLWIHYSSKMVKKLVKSVLRKDLTFEDYAKKGWVELNQGTWKLTQLKKLNFEEVKAEFEKLVKQLDTYVPMNFEATKESLKRFGEELQTKMQRSLKFDDEGTTTEEKIEEDKMIANQRRLERGEKTASKEGSY
ncbi:hypothetical protein Tco_0625909 [Tanacetum coccineum]|uniref:Uncharacterized protein n=1 Tax=Tanacetum coccineum TaxID=301880 RepID=A0ABQ4WI34_9ASTR